MSSEQDPVAWLRPIVEDDLKFWRDRETALAPDVEREGEYWWRDARERADRAEAELAILDVHRWVDWDDEHYSGTGCITCDYQSRGHVDRSASKGAVSCYTVRLLAGGYRHRPGYREEDWRPSP